ncbi:MAG: hypothetical protein ACO1OB_25610 [Archangium sp.]
MKKALVLVLALAGCEAKVMMPGTPGLLEDGGCPPEGRNDEVRHALSGACAGCHTGGNKPYWASLDAFENGLVYDERWVKRGDPDNSGLIKIIEGHNPGSYPQMPPGETFEATVADGRSKISLDELKVWIRELPERGSVNEGPSPDAFTVRRLRSDEMIQSLMKQLGLELADFVATDSPNWKNEAYTVRGGRFFMWPTDWSPGISGQYVSDSRATERYESLGGAVILQGRKNDATLGPTAMQSLTQASQAWCRMAVDKANNKAVLRHVTLADTSDTKSVEIKKNITSLSLRMLGEPPSDADVNELYADVYLPLEPQGTKFAWSAVCAALIRHPKWLAY